MLGDVTDSLATLIGSLTGPGSQVSAMLADRAYKDKLPGTVGPAPQSGLPSWVLLLAIGGLAAVAIVAYSSSKSSKKPASRRRR